MNESPIPKAKHEKDTAFEKNVVIYIYQKMILTIFMEDDTT